MTENRKIHFHQILSNFYYNGKIDDKMGPNLASLLYEQPG